MMTNWTGNEWNADACMYVYIYYCEVAFHS